MAQCERQYSHCGDVLSREGIGGVTDEKTCLSHSTEEGRQSRQGGGEGAKEGMIEKKRERKLLL